MNPRDTPDQPTFFPIGSFAAQRIEDAFSLMGPKWTTWSVMTMAQEGRPMRVRDVAVRLPFVSEQLVGKRLAAMHADGLVTRTDKRHGAPYRLSALGESLTHVHRTLADWSRNYLSPGAMAEAERVEDAVQRLRLRHSTAMIQVLDAGGPMRFVHIAEGVGLDVSLTQHRLLRLQADGLVTRTGPRHGDPYVLTDASRELGPVYATVEHWSAPLATQRVPSSPASVPVPQRTHPGVPLGSDGARTAAALRRSAAVSNALFSHASKPQSRVPTAVTAQSTPGRGT
ncbi:winged helix-turn-helix transcriptional regulator [Streptomyces zaomyceticus]|uniref:Winged helix-turn-helix transcriptional regulator n=1 Tax=Streptomyces zaomyceticus TaxID=68286 RepID=A0ABZ1LH13_9ACTN